MHKVALHKHLEMYGYHHQNHINFDDEAGCFFHAIYASEDPDALKVTIPIRYEEIPDEFVDDLCTILSIPSPYQPKGKA